MNHNSINRPAGRPSRALCGLKSLLLAASVLAVFSGSVAFAQTSPLEVTTTADTLDASDGLTSLREAINFANSDADASEVTFANNVTGTITLTGGELGITTNTTVTGPGANVLTVSGNNASRVFNVSNNANATILGLTLTKGESGLDGGSLYAAEGTTVLVRSCSVTNSHCTRYGGGLANFGTMTLRESTITGNRSDSDSGGVDNDGTLTMTNCTVSDNTSGGVGGGVGVYGTTSVANCTVVGNSARLAGGVGPRATVLNNSIVVDNTPNNVTGNLGAGSSNNITTGTAAEAGLDSAGLADNGGPTKTIALVAGSPAIDAGDPNFDGAGLFDQRGAGYSRVIGGRLDIGAFELGLAPTVVTNAATNVTSTSATLNATINAGGTVTSAQFQYGTDTTYGNTITLDGITGTTDQTVSANPAGLTPLTTYHFRATATNREGTTNGGDVTFTTLETQSLVVTTTSDVVDNTDGLTSLREAINFANSDADQSDIIFDTTVFAATQTINLTLGELPITQNATITGPGAGVIAAHFSAEGTPDFRVLNVLAGATVSLRDITLSGGRSNEGAGVANAGVLMLDRCTVSNNTGIADPDTGGQARGAGVFNVGTLTVSNSTIAGNHNSFGQGGGLLNTGNLTLSNATVSGNSAYYNGGGLYNFAGIVTVSSSTITNNVSGTSGDNGGGSGGGIFDYNSDTKTGSLSLANAILAANHFTSGPFGADGNDCATASAGEPTSLNSLDYNLIGDPTDCTIAGQTTHNITGVDPRLGPLDINNGGPTATMALLSGSPAINAGDPAFDGMGKTDQRGANFPRVVGGRLDIGAYESPFVPPVVSDVSVSTNEDTTFTFAADSFDGGFADNNSGQTLQSVRIDSLPTNGTLNYDGLAATAGQVIARADLSKLSFAPDADFNSAASFSFNASNGTLFANSSATLTINVAAVNDAPSFTKGADQTVSEDAPAQTVTGFATNISAGPSDESGQVLTFTATNDNAALFAVAPALNAKGDLTYTSAPNANGVANVSVTLKDDGGTANGGVDTSALQTFTITVTAVNDAPVADSQSVVTDEDISKTIVLTATDVDSVNLTYRVIKAPTQGTLTGAAPNLTYAPNADYNGADSFTFVANDGALDSSPATVSITINPVNDAPVAVDRSEAIARNTATPFTLRATDIDSPNLTYSVISGPTVGTVSGTAPNLTYTPQRNYTGQDSLTFKANDGALDSNVATVTFVVGANNVAPVAFSKKVATSEDKALTITLNANDNNGDDLTYDVIAQPAHGTLTGAAPNLVYTPDTDFNGADSFSFSANDGTVDGNIATVSINVNAVNDAPSFSVGSGQVVAENGGAQTVTGFATNIKAGPANEAGQALTFVVTNDNDALFSVQPSLDAKGTLTYTLAPNAAGRATISVKLQDDGGVASGGVDTSGVQTFAITVTANPINFGVSITPKAPFTRDTLTATPVIADATNVTYSYEWFVNGTSVQKGAGNTLDMSQPGFGDKGDIVSVTVSAANNRGGAGATSNRVTVRNSVPFAFSGTATAKSGVETLIPFKTFGNPGGGDSDIGDVITYKRVGGPKNGTATFVVNADGSSSLRYTARRGFSGVESIQFVAVDSSGQTSNIATLGIDVQGQPILSPTAEDAIGQTTSGVQVDVPISGSDPNGGQVTFKRVGGPVNGGGGLVTLANGTTVMRYIPRSNFVGVEEIRFVALNSDGRPSNVATIRISVSARSGASAAGAGSAPSAGNS